MDEKIEALKKASAVLALEATHYRDSYLGQPFLTDAIDQVNMILAEICRQTLTDEPNLNPARRTTAKED